MLVLLPPSETKFSPRRGAALDLDALTAPELLGPRTAILDALVELCATDPVKAAETLGLGRTQSRQVERNQALREAATAPAAKVYTGVLYAALDPPSIAGAAKRRLHRWALVQSALFGLVRLADRIPAYRLSGDTTLPGLGTVSRHWREPLAAVLPRLAGNGLVVDLRSSAYTGFWKGDRRTVSVRVLREVAGARRVVSHLNKATKGRILRGLVEDGGTPRTPAELTEHLAGLGWQAELTAPRRVDVVVGEMSVR